MASNRNRQFPPPCNCIHPHLVFPTPNRNPLGPSGESIGRIDHMERETKFVCKMKFRYDLPEPTHHPKLCNVSNRGTRRFTEYRYSSLEKQQRPEIHVEPDLGIPLDLLDLSVYNPPKGVSLRLDPEDEKLLQDDDDCVKPLKKERQRPDDRDVPWLLKSKYRSTSLRMPKKIQHPTVVQEEEEQVTGNQNMGDEGSSREGDQLVVANSETSPSTSVADAHQSQERASSSASNQVTTRPKRNRKIPAYLADYEYELS